MMMTGATATNIPPVVIPIAIIIGLTTAIVPRDTTPTTPGVAMKIVGTIHATAIVKQCCR